MKLTDFLLVFVLFYTSKCSSVDDTKAVRHESSKDPPQEKLFFRSFSTRTATVLSFFTSTVPFTCVSTSAGTMDCTGRRKRSAEILPELEGSSVDELNSSLNQAEPQLQKVEDKNAEGKLFGGLTVWSTTSTTQTVTTYITDSSITVGLIAQCTVSSILLRYC